ncbi:hypothetical protein PROVALCAL_02318 [Providencia alcalifaciens DSM 30120]|uniref:Uncharacterized protein n=1 Tax=Providencia alcalifaciens DSM 30120 TaxID=520999 RepID=B6XG87_9GAMM|nr:hypothetical protein PROVALCAL_02318 [Providencia alcalifaciens DSM 30120]
MLRIKYPDSTYENSTVLNRDHPKKARLTLDFIALFIGHCYGLTYFANTLLLQVRFYL